MKAAQLRTILEERIVDIRVGPFKFSCGRYYAFCSTMASSEAGWLGYF